MAQYKQPEITNVFWALNDGLKGGRAPLGIQKSSIATYSKLLPGLTNLTRHIRYYSPCLLLVSPYGYQKSNHRHLCRFVFVCRKCISIALDSLG